MWVRENDFDLCILHIFVQEENEEKKVVMRETLNQRRGFELSSYDFQVEKFFVLVSVNDTVKEKVEMDNTRLKIFKIQCPAVRRT